jgi:hypothetical protein
VKLCRRLNIREEKNTFMAKCMDSIRIPVRNPLYWKCISAAQLKVFNHNNTAISIRLRMAKQNKTQHLSKSHWIRSTKRSPGFNTANVVTMLAGLLSPIFVLYRLLQKRYTATKKRPSVRITVILWNRMVWLLL